MSLRDDISLRLDRTHIDADAMTARRLIEYHVSEREIAGFHSTETSHPPGFRIPGHFHEFDSLYVVLQGSLTEFYGRRQRECKPSSVVFTPAGETHSDLFNNAGGRCLLVEIPSSFIERLAEAGVRLRDSLHSQGGMLAWLTIRLYREFERPDAMSQLSVEGLMLEALSELGRWNEKPSATAPLWLRQARSLLQDRFSENLGLDEIAESVGVHPAHLARSFRRCYGSTAGEYQRRLRVEYASRQLSETNTPILSIALTAGFADQAHFSRTFRDHTGMTPARFRAAFGVGKLR
jgi:AraC family transcriptional regulator